VRSARPLALVELGSLVDDDIVDDPPAQSDRLAGLGPRSAMSNLLATIRAAAWRCRVRTLAQFALAISLATVSLVGCGVLPMSLSKGQDDTQQPIDAQGALPQTAPIAPARSAARRLSASYQQLYRFHPPFDGTRPVAGLLDVNGTLYGTTSGGGLRAKGTIYRITTSGAHKALYRFRGGSDGLDPQSSGLLDVNGTLYGMTEFGGGGSGCYATSHIGCGTVYSVSTSGTEKVMHAFQGGSDGALPESAGLIDVNGTLYGTTAGGGNQSCDYGCGTVFSVTTNGDETVLHSFAGGGSDGAFPFASLVAVNGTLYGTTYEGGTYGRGTVFSISTSGKEKLLFSFAGGSDGMSPGAGLINVSGTLYGTTEFGGGAGCKSSHTTRSGCGTVFSVTTSGQETVLYRFGGGSDGYDPEVPLIDVNGTLYGTTNFGGAYGPGTVFSISASGKEKVLHSFAGGSDGAGPYGGLIDVNGTLYGTTEFGGGTHRHGTVFALTL
jgi:uncharacterized repeat protein (TIGR03803 family)